MMRQKTVRMAFGTSRRGFFASPAATPTSSVPWNENPAIMKTEMIETHPPWNTSSRFSQLLSPGEEPPRMPKIISTPAARKITTALTLMRESQNSDSPKDLAGRALSPVRTSRKIPAHTQPGIPGNQKSMMIPAATSSAATVMAQLNQ